MVTQNSRNHSIESILHTFSDSFQILISPRWKILCLISCYPFFLLHSHSVRTFCQVDLTISCKGMQLGNWLGLFILECGAYNTWNCDFSVLLIKFNSLSLKRKEDRDHGDALLVENVYRLFGNLCRKIPPILSHVTMRYQEMREDDWRSWVHMCCDQSLSGSWESNFSCHLMEEESTEYSETRLEQSEPFKGTFLCSISFEIFISSSAFYM